MVFATVSVKLDGEKLNEAVAETGKVSTVVFVEKEIVDASAGPVNASHDNITNSRIAALNFIVLRSLRPD